MLNPEDYIIAKENKTETKVSNNFGRLNPDNYLLPEKPVVPKKTTFQKKHPILSSIPEAGKQFGIRAVKSYPEFARGLNDAVALTGDLLNNQGISDFGKRNADYWQKQSDKIQIDPRYQGLQGLSSKETFLPTIMGELGGQATNIAASMGAGALGSAAANAMKLKTVGQTAMSTAGMALPNLAQEGQYLDKINQFKQVYGREPNSEELRNIQNITLGEKGLNTVLETAADKLLFNKLFPNTKMPKGFMNKTKKIGKDILGQTITEAGTEGMQEGVSVGSEKLLGINQNNTLDNLKRIGEAATMGGITGGILGGGASTIGSITNGIQEAAPNTYTKMQNNPSPLIPLPQGAGEMEENIPQEGSAVNANQPQVQVDYNGAYSPDRVLYPLSTEFAPNYKLSDRPEVKYPISTDVKEIYDNFENNNKTYLPEKKEAAYSILSAATGKSSKWLKMQKNKSLEKILDLISNTDDKITVNGLDPSFTKYYPEISKVNDNSNESIGIPYKVARQAL